MYGALGKSPGSAASNAARSRVSLETEALGFFRAPIAAPAPGPDEQTSRWPEMTRQETHQSVVRESRTQQEHSGGRRSGSRQQFADRSERSSAMIIGGGFPAAYAITAHSIDETLDEFRYSNVRCVAAPALTAGPVRHSWKTVRPTKSLTLFRPAHVLRSIFAWVFLTFVVFPPHRWRKTTGQTLQASPPFSCHRLVAMAHREQQHET
ncbi:hypothetical protein K227x_55550 [Rubripirellula lacrimiformis]|uniref:Uncharacterized protein n=1 Tax=Rubripirellula lacrimiformis TaxID=1930273 RepID=A0A517NJ18_9BACT|nr:hypothetical protein K227x_55550 [Rubripirellula lacrimiformis]